MIGKREMAGDHTRGRIAVAASALSLLLALVLVSGAGAAQLTAQSFGGLGSEAGQFSLPGGIALTPNGRHLLVADTENARIDEYSVAGPTVEFARAFGWGVEDGSAELQTCTEESGCLKGLTGFGEGELNEPVGIAISTDGSTAYVIDRARKDGRIQKFKLAKGAVTYTGALAAGYGEDEGNQAGFSYPLPFTNDIAIGSEGTVYVGDDNEEEGPRVVAFAGSGKPKSIPVTVETITAIAAGGAGKIYVGGADGSIALIEKGAEKKRFEPGLSEISAIALDPRSGNLIVESNAYEETGENQYELVLSEVSAKGEVTGSIGVDGISEPREPISFGLAVDPTAQLEATESFEYEPGAIFVVDRYSPQIYALAEGKPAKPAVAELSALPQGTEVENLRASVTPRGADTHAYFEYGPTAAYGSSVPLPPGQDVGSSFEGATLAVQLTGLRPGTTYHYAVVASNAFGTVVSEDRTFQTLPVEGPFSLPDERAWELVSTEKGDGEVLLESGSGQAGLAGGAVSFTNIYPLPSTAANLRVSTYASFRGASGWTTTGISVPSVLGATDQRTDEVKLISGDLTRSVASTLAALVEGAPSGANLYLRDDLTGSETLMTPYRRSPGEETAAEVRAASSDFGHIVLSAGGRLTPDTPSTAKSSLYDYTGGALRDIGYLPGASTPTTNLIKAPEAIAPNAVSEDGSHIFFEAEPKPAKGGGTNALQVFVRIDDTRTVEVSASKARIADPEAAEQPALFVGASKSGRYAFFTSSAELTDDANTGERPEEGLRERPNLYRYDVDTGELTDLSVTSKATDEENGADVRGVVIAPDGLSAYFAAYGNLAPGGTSGEPDLYRWSQSGGTVFATKLAENDVFAEGVSPALAGSRISDDGSVLVLLSHRNLDPRFQGFEEVEFYRYSAVEGSAVCMSCTPFEAQTEADASLSEHSLSADGSRFFFDSPIPLVTGDTNGTTDVYEWEGGAPHLISSGTGRRESSFLDASPSGEDTFFTTTQPLVPGDVDEVGDLYDARVRGGFPVAAEPLPGCEGEACRPPASAPPASAPDGSGSFQGPPDAKPKRHGRKHKKHRHRHHRHRGSKRAKAGRRHARRVAKKGAGR